MVKSEKEQERIDFLAGFRVTDEVIRLIQIIDTPDEEERVMPIEVQDERPALSPEKSKAIGRLSSIIVTYAHRHIRRLEDEEKLSHYSSGELVQALSDALDLFRRKKIRARMPSFHL